MYYVSKIFHFDAAHRLYDYEGKCHNLHGHTWKVEITLSGELNDEGMVVDFNKIEDVVGSFIDDTLDHSTILNEKDSLLKKIDTKHVVLENDPTSEHLAEFIYNVVSQRLPETTIESVTVWESPTSYATFKRPKAKYSARWMPTKPLSDYRSKCCNAPVKLSKPAPDFLGDDPDKMEYGTIYFVCTKCGKPCDIRLGEK